MTLLVRRNALDQEVVAEVLDGKRVRVKLNQNLSSCPSDTSKVAYATKLIH